MGCIQNQPISPELSVIEINSPIYNPHNPPPIKPYSNNQYPAARLPTSQSEQSTQSKFIYNKGLSWSKNENQDRIFCASLNSCPYF
ncbi:unnamed protein product [Paramecium sonneborni]|uniref:Uncharacterized protein n=1 Tax=Paramecium sonneborni TaxID=65129 RepID=A0A8S1L1F2_9CILI|nr:unnamed protein product [Paramecium sonneborni]